MTSEAAVQQLIRLDAAQQGLSLWRNNSGACYDDTGRLVRYGLGNDSAQLNRVFKSGDLIGVTPVTVTPEMVGKFIGVFTSVEVKQSGWTHVTTDHERAQQNFIDTVRKFGGIAGFANSVETFREVVGK